MARTILAVVALVFVVFCSSVDAARQYERRSDLAEQLPAVDLAWSTPLEGSEDCNDPSRVCTCIDFSSLGFHD
jgi:hypothetical protein